MTLIETFEKYTQQEFPPKYVFVYHNQKPKSILVSELKEYNTMYVCSDGGDDFSNLIGKLSADWKTPIAWEINPTQP